MASGDVLNVTSQSTGKPITLVDVQYNTGTTPVNASNQVIAIGDDNNSTGAPNVAQVLNTVPTGTEHGLLVRQVNSPPLPTGAATSALQPALNADGGALVHVTNAATFGPSGVSGTTITPATIGVVYNQGIGTSGVTPTSTYGFPNWVTGQLTLTATTATLIVAARTGVPGVGRGKVTVVNNSTTAIYLGSATVTSSNGLILPGVVGASITLETTAAIYGCLSVIGSAAISFYELY